MRRTIADGLSLMLMLNVPATVGLIVLATPIVRVIFERGAFTPADTAATAAALQFYAHRPARLLGRAHRVAGVLRARARTARRCMVSIATVLVNAALNIVLVAGARISRAGARHVDRRAVQRDAAARPACAAASAASRAARGGIARSRSRAASALMARRGVGGRRVAAASLVPGSGFAAAGRFGWRASIGAALCRAGRSPRTLLHIREFREGVALVTRRFSRTALMPIRPLGLHPTILLLASTHFLVDGYGNIYAPLLPLLIPQLNLSLAAAGTLQMCFQMANSVAQLGFGHLADRWRPRALLVAGPLVAVTVLSLVGLAPNVWMLGGGPRLGGLGGAAFHPPAAALVHRLAGTRQGLAMSFHITGGSLGFSLGAAAVRAVRRAVRAAVDAAADGAGAGAARVVPAQRAAARAPRRSGTRRPDSARCGRTRKPLTLLYLIVVLRTLTALSFSTFMPVMLTQARHVGGRSRDGGRRSICSRAASAGSSAARSPTAGARGASSCCRWSWRCRSWPSRRRSTGWTFVAVLSIGGFLLQSTLPVNVTFGQMIAPISAATVSSLMMGFAWGTGGLSAPFVGMLADRIGIERTLVIMAFMPLAAAALALPLPAGKHAHATARASDVATPETTGTDVAP